MALAVVSAGSPIRVCGAAIIDAFPAPGTAGVHGAAVVEAFATPRGLCIMAESVRIEGAACIQAIGLGRITAAAVGIKAASVVTPKTVEPFEEEAYWVCRRLHLERLEGACINRQGCREK